MLYEIAGEQNWSAHQISPQLFNERESHFKSFSRRDNFSLTEVPVAPEE